MKVCGTYIVADLTCYKQCNLVRQKEPYSRTHAQWMVARAVWLKTSATERAIVARENFMATLGAVVSDYLVSERGVSFLASLMRRDVDFIAVHVG